MPLVVATQSLAGWSNCIHYTVNSTECMSSLAANASMIKVEYEYGTPTVLPPSVIHVMVRNGPNCASICRGDVKGGVSPDMMTHFDNQW